jgi:hypothetical protein
MPLYLDISRIDRRVVITAHGHITPEQIAAIAKQTIEANVSHFGKIIDVTLSTSDLTKDQVERIAALLRGHPGDRSRGPLAFVIDPKREGFANAFADVTNGDRPVMLFHAIHAARKWLDTYPRA